MTLFVTLLLAFFGLFSGLALNNVTDSQAQARDTVRKNDINSLFAKLEEHYNDQGDYPTPKQLEEQGADNFPGIDPEALIDNFGTPIWNPASEYYYSPSGCSAIGCQKYELGTLLENGTTYSKNSLN